MRFGLLFGLALLFRQEDQEQFRTIEISIDPGGETLAAYQFELDTSSKIVGIEGVEKTAFQEAPFYDPAALKGGRIVIAAYTLDAAPAGKVRVARLHLLERAAARYEPRLVAAASASGRRIEAKLIVGEAK